MEGAGAAGAEEAAGGADWGKETLIEAVGIGGGRRIGADRDEGNVAAGIAGVGEAANVDAVEEVEGFGHEVEMETFFDGDGFHQAQVDGIERAAEINSVRNIFQRAAGVARGGGGAGRQGVPFVDDAIQLGAVLHAASQRIAREDGQAGGERLRR